MTDIQATIVHKGTKEHGGLTAASTVILMLHTIPVLPVHPPGMGLIGPSGKDQNTL